MLELHRAREALMSTVLDRADVLGRGMCLYRGCTVHVLDSGLYCIFALFPVQPVFRQVQRMHGSCKYRLHFVCRRVLFTEWRLCDNAMPCWVYSGRRVQGVHQVRDHYCERDGRSASEQDLDGVFHVRQRT